MKRFIVVAALGLSLLPTAGCSRKKDGDVRLNAGGSTFVGPMMQKWKQVYNKETGVEIDYALKGSGQGISQMTAKTYDFGCTDGPMRPDQIDAAKKEGGDVVHIPLTLGAVVPIYNLGKDYKDTKLQFTGEVLGLIYLGKITNWSDDKIKAINKGVKLPDLKIVVVHRAEPSGTTFIWTDFLAKTSKDWKKKFGPEGDFKVDWPVGLGKSQNDGVASHVNLSAGAIGYVELIYALNKGIEFGAVKNAAGKYIKAEMENVSAAAAGALEKDVPEDLTFNLTDMPGEKPYPICGAVWAVLYQDQTGNPKGKEVVKFLRWVTHEGQKYCEELHYAKLPEGIVKLVDKKLDSIKVK
jgi:phosphate transport system substrate-binding protein